MKLAIEDSFRYSLVQWCGKESVQGDGGMGESEVE